MHSFFFYQVKVHALLFIVSALCSLFSASYVEASKNQSGFSIELIHRDSHFSPFYNSSKSTQEIITNAALRSNSRINQIFLPLSLSPNKNNEYPEAMVIPNSGDYLMRIYIGTPPVERLVIVDTGSDLTWVQCLPCLHCFKQDIPFFDITKSSTFEHVSCGSTPCSLLPQDHKFCGISKECLYSYIYGGAQSLSFGQLGTDLITFGSHETKFPKSTFGCGNFNDFAFNDVNGRTTGIVGLGGGPLSLVSQLGDITGKKFSYCLLPFSSKTTSKMRFGNQAKIIGRSVVSTPIITNPSLPTLYLVNLQGITVGEKTVQTERTDGNIIIDSGSTLTLFEPIFFNAFVTLLKETIGVEAVEDEAIPVPFQFCFTNRDDLRFPDVVFHFKGASITLKPMNLLLSQKNNIICLAAITSNFQGISIFGNIAQIDFQVEYDLEGKKVSFAPTDCEKLNSIS